APSRQPVKASRDIDALGALMLEESRHALGFGAL
ncbi:MAG: hypothetical protein JWR64_415, partial [Marmoricola sp.]|nr:hypothetical protein [Marmoricola sp.]